MARLVPSATWIAYLGGLMALYGIFMALKQTKMRPLLSYHIISQLGYMVASIGIGGEMGINGGLLHLLNHMVYKTLLLMIAATVIYLYGSDDLSRQQRKPIWLLVMAIIASFAIIGIPPFNGFISKSLIKYATNGLPLQAILSVASVGTAVSFAKFLYFGFIRDLSHSPIKPLTTRKLPVASLISMLSLTGIIIALGLSSGLNNALLPYGYSSVYSVNGVFTSLRLAGMGFVLFWLIKPLLDPAMHQQHGHARTPAGSIAVVPSHVITSLSVLESHITKLSNAQYLVVTITTVILLSLFVF